MTLTAGKLILAKDYIYGPADPDVAAYIAAVETADGQGLEEEVKAAYSNFITGCKADGIWNAIKASCILAGARTLSGALVPLVGTAPTNFNFVAADYNRKTGLKGDNSAKNLNANRLGDADPTNNQHQSIYVSTSATGGGYPQYISSSDGSRFRNIAWNIGLGIYVFPNTTSIGADSGGGSPTGFTGHSRDNASTFDFFVNSTLTADINQGSSAAPNADTVLFSLSDGTNRSNGRIAFYSIGEALDLALLDARVSTLISDLGAAIP
jgi:hypothetical protein